MATSHLTPAPPPNAFLREAQRSGPGFARELVTFLRDNQKWWLVPIVVVLLLVGALIFLGGTAAAPFIYTLF